MKMRLTPVIFVAVLLLGLAGCLPAQPKNLSVDKSYSGKEVNLAASATLTISLVSNPSTGYSWDKEAEISDPAVIAQTDHRFEASKVPVVGAPGVQVWTFQTLGPGTSTISMDYKSPTVSLKDADTFSLTVNVK
jgi:inhibitor of cysteine peptidase